MNWNRTTDTTLESSCRTFQISRICYRNQCPRNKPHLRKVGAVWVQHWPDGWKQYIATWGGKVPRFVLSRNMVMFADATRVTR